MQTGSSASRHNRRLLTNQLGRFLALHSAKGGGIHIVVSVVEATNHGFTKILTMIRLQLFHIVHQLWSPLLVAHIEITKKEILANSRYFFYVAKVFDSRPSVSDY